MNKRKALLGLVVAIVVLAGVMASCRQPVINDVKTGETDAYPDLQPQRFQAEVDEVFDAATEALEALDIEVTESDRANGEIRGVATTRILRFKDDVTITITREADESIVNIRSASRVGKSDFGVNAKRIRELQSAIEQRIGESAARSSR